ncbi:MAG: hypothetical protein M3N02_06765, partial [Pseudomonadota bacterium]|nr:hypothetical protein [Pseudomonadota bacterium]
VRAARTAPSFRVSATGVAITAAADQGRGMSQHLVLVVERLLANAPQWLRQDLLSKDPSIRQRAEETLAAMIAAALSEPTPSKAEGGAKADPQP